MYCINCGAELINDSGYETIARCCNPNCEEYNIPKSVENIVRNTKK